MQENKMKSAYPLENIFLDCTDESNYVYMKSEIPWYVKMLVNCDLWLHVKGFFLMEKPSYRELDERKSSFFHFL